MVISRFQYTQPRNRIGFVEENPPQDAVRELKDVDGYELFRFEASHLTDRSILAATAAVIFRQSTTKPARIFTLLDHYAKTLLWQDCRLFVQPVAPTPGAIEPAFRDIVINALNTLRLPPSGLSEQDAKAFDDWFDGVEAPRLTPVVHVLIRPGIWRDVAVLLRSSPPGAVPGYDLQIDAVDSDGVAFSLPPEQQMLVRRSFWDCASIKLVGVKNGLSEALTFRAFAHLREDLVGSTWPYVYFVKLGERSKISREFLAYESTALGNIPYHLGPRLRLDRCALGHLQGIIVCDYVSGAEALRDCARDGRAVPAIANLFNSTLRAWRNSANPEHTPLHVFLGGDLPSEIPAHRRPLVEAYGASGSLQELRTVLTARGKEPVLVGAVHGDLHATNVLVRGGDAILIDFEKVRDRHPLLWDMACLEGGLFVDGFVDDRRPGVAVLHSVGCLYEAAAFSDDVYPCHPSDSSAWFFDCVRQIRMQARQVELKPGQYALTLAVALARKACNVKDFRADKTKAPAVSVPLSREDVRALAYVLSERILMGLT